MFQTIPLSTILDKWADALATDEAITQFCNEKYGKPAQLYIGYDDAEAPIEEDCPCIILLPSSKNEGLDDTYTYLLTVVWGINHSGAERVGHVIKYYGTPEVDRLGQLIIECLQSVNPAYPVTAIDYELDTMTWRPVYTGRLTATIEIPHVIGGLVEY